MPSTYLSPDGSAEFDVGSATRAQIAAACALVDAYLMRPEGLVWVPDAQGAPCYMAALAPSYSIQASAPFGPGTNVVVQIPSSAVLQDKLGAAVVVDRAGACEACIIQSVAAGSVTLSSVMQSHSSGATIEFGLIIEEERSLPSKRSLTRAAKLPVARLIAGVGRYGFGRRSDQVQGLYNDTNLLATIQTFGGPPQWVSWNVAQASVSMTTGEIWVPAGMLLAYYSDVRLWYVAGYPADQVPVQIKTAAASIARLSSQYPEMSGNIKSFKAGDTQVQRFKDVLLDAETKALLDPFRARIYG